MLPSGSTLNFPQAHPRQKQQRGKMILSFIDCTISAIKHQAGDLQLAVHEMHMRQRTGIALHGLDHMPAKYISRRPPTISSIASGSGGHSVHLPSHAPLDLDSTSDRG